MSFHGFVETGMNMNGSHPTMKNCEGSMGTHNRLLRGQSRSFQVIEAPRGRPFLVRRRSSQRDWVLPEITVIVEFNMEMPLVFPFCGPVAAGIVFVFMGNPKFASNCKAPVSEGTMPIPPNRPCALRLCHITFSGVIAPGGVPQRRGAEALCRSPQ